MPVGGKVVDAMATVTLTPNELDVIRSVVDRYRQALLFEIANTDSRDLRAYLRERDLLVEDLIARLDTARTEPAPAVSPIYCIN